MKRVFVSLGVLPAAFVLTSSSAWADTIRGHSAVVANLMDIATLEPARLLLVGTGLIVAASYMRRRLDKRNGA